MSWNLSWKALARRITVFSSQCQPYITSMRNGDPFKIGNNFYLPRTKQFFDDIELFKSKNEICLPKEASEVLREFISKDNKDIFSSPPVGSYMAGVPLHDPETPRWLVQFRAALLSSFITEFEYSLSDWTAVITRQTERTFAHLQRLIAVDSDYRSKWENAFSVNEVACEKLGAVHLFSHGIYCFKADSAGARTDLVFQEKYKQTTENVVDALVLTEWKLARTCEEVVKKAKEAVKQAKRYRRDVLIDFELSEIAYIIVVTEDFCTMPTDHEDGGVIYRHLNIAVNPSTPSKAATKSGR